MRLFLAINLPESLRQSIWAAAADLRARDYPVRWVGVDAIHLTMKFLGEVDSEREKNLIEAIEGAVAGTKRFALPIAGFGAFPSARRARVVWVGCHAVPPLNLLHERMEQRLERLGFPVEGRPFRPHLTLGRVRRGARARELRGIDEILCDLVVEGESDVLSVDLMESRLSRAGARYTRRHAIPLEA